MYRAVLPGFSFGNLTAGIGIPITCLCPPSVRGHTRLTSLLYDSGGAPHTVTVLKSLGTTTLSVAAASSATAITLLADPGTGTVSGAMTSGDYLCVALDDLTFFLTTVKSLSSLTYTLKDALPGAAALGNAAWFFGVPADHASSQTRTANPPAIGLQFSADAILNPLQDFASGICASNNANEPLLLHSGNTGIAGVFRLVAGCHTTN